MTAINRNVCIKVQNQIVHLTEIFSVHVKLKDYILGTVISPR